MRARGCWLAALVAALLVSPPGASQDRPEAREAYERGTIAFQRGDFAIAAALFARADQLSPSEAALQAALEAALAADDPVLGNELLERARRGVPGAPLGAVVRRATARLAGRAGRLVAECGASCEASIDGVSVAPRQPRWVKLGRHTVAMRLRQAERTVVVEISPDALLLVPGPQDEAPAVSSSPVSSPVSSAPIASVSSAPIASVAPVFSVFMATPERPGPVHSRLHPGWFWAGAGVTAAAGVLALVWGLDTAHRHDEFASRGCLNTGGDPCDLLASAGQAAQLRANLMIGTAVLAGGVTVALGLWGVRRGTIEGAVGPGGAKVQGRF